MGMVRKTRPNRFKEGATRVIITAGNPMTHQKRERKIAMNESRDRMVFSFMVPLLL